MTLDTTQLVTAIVALLGVLGLILLIARVARRVGVGSQQPGGRRLRLEESLPLDARRRLVLVRCEGRGLLLLTGGATDQVVGWLPEPEA